MTDDKDEMVLITVKLPAATDLSVEAVAETLGVDDDDIDASFGIVPVDPQRKLYAVMLRASKVTDVGSRLGEDMKGPFSDPEISPFGPVQ